MRALSPEPPERAARLSARAPKSQAARDALKSFREEIEKVPADGVTDVKDEADKAADPEIIIARASHRLVNQRLVDTLNDDGRIYLTQTLVDGVKVIRFTAGQFDCEERDFDTAFDTITEIARR